MLQYMVGYLPGATIDSVLKVFFACTIAELYDPTREVEIAWEIGGEVRVGKCNIGSILNIKVESLKEKDDAGLCS